MLKSISEGIMNNKIRMLAFFGIGTLFFLLVANFPASRLCSQPRRVWVPPTVMGGVQVELNPNSLAPCIAILVGGRRVTTAIVRLDDRTNIPPNAGGNYCLNVRYPAITYNMPVKISMRSNIPGEWEAEADGLVSALFEIVKPTNGQVISLGAIDSLTVQWRFTAGRVPIEKVDLYRVDTDETFVYDPVAGADYVKISKLALRRDKRYQVFLWAKLANFKTRGPLASSSYIEMRLHTGTEFRTTR